jgi:hypothetical protein
VDTFNRFAARVKLRSSATARNADKTLSSSRTIIHSWLTALADCTDYSGPASQVTLIIERIWRIAADRERCHC